METKLYEKNCVTVDGKLDEAVWESAKVYSGFKNFKSRGGAPAAVETEFRILPCEDRVYLGIKCIEPDIELEYDYELAESEGIDNQVEKAIEVLEGKIAD